MKLPKILVAVAALLLAGHAWAHPVGAHGWHGGGGRHGWHPHHGGAMILFGAPLFAPPLDDPFFRAPMPEATEPPPVYVERADAGAPAQPQPWYYCDASGTYYPYVKECPGGWRAVAPQR